MITKNEHLERRIKELGGVDMFARTHECAFKQLTEQEFIACADAVAKLFAEHFGIETP